MPVCHIHIELLVRPLDLAVNPVEDVEIRGEIKLSLTNENKFLSGRNHRGRSSRRRCMERKPEMERQREERQHPESHISRGQGHEDPTIIDQTRRVQIEGIPQLSDCASSSNSGMGSPSLSRRRENLVASPLKTECSSRLRESSGGEVFEISRS
jgi:hypothetical protein